MLNIKSTDCFLAIMHSVCLEHLFRIIISLCNNEVHFLYVIIEFKQFIALALILLVNLMNENGKKKEKDKGKGATLAGGGGGGAGEVTF